jgi:hypothetical protein
LIGYTILLRGYKGMSCGRKVSAILFLVQLGLWADAPKTITLLGSTIL